MIDRVGIATELGGAALEEIIVDQILNGKNDAIKVLSIFIDDLKKCINDNINDDVLVFKIIGDLVMLKKELYTNGYNEFLQLKNNAFKFNKVILSSSISDDDQLRLIANYFLDFHDFNKSNNRYLKIQIHRIREISRYYYLEIDLMKQSSLFFDILNDKCKIDDYHWNWGSFERNVVKVISEHALQMISIKNNCNLEIDLMKLDKDRNSEKLNDKIGNLQEKIISLENKNDYVNDYFNKYYFNNQIQICNTYFGDNTPFLLNLFNFLKKNNMLDYSWSYFHSCMVLGNNEMISLISFKKNTFTGYFLLKLKDYLVMQYQDNYFEFYKSKFLINGTTISDSFKRNYFKKDFDNQMMPELDKIDVFFKEQQKIYLKL